MKKPRKAWRADLKWLFGIFATVLLTVALTSFATYRVTTNPDMEKMQKKMTGKSSTGSFNIADMMSGGKGSKGTMPKLKIGGKEYTVDQLKSMPEADLQKLMADPKTAESFGSMMGAPGSKNGSAQPDMKAFENMGKTLEDPSKLGSMLQPMAMQAIMPVVIGINESAKGLSMTLFIGTLLGALLFLGLMMGVSYRFGRLSSLALVLTLAALPTFAAATFFKSIGVFGGSPMSSGLPDPLYIAAILGNSNFALFLSLLIFAGFLLFVSLLGSVIMSMVGRSNKPKPAQVTAPAAPKASTAAPQPPAAKAS